MNLRICFIVDARSPIARSWIESVAKAGVEVHVISTHAADPTSLPTSSFHEVGLAFSAAGSDAGIGVGKALRSLASVRRQGSWMWRAMTNVLRWVKPLDVFRHRHAIRRLVDTIKPDLVHAMRIPYEGLLASEALVDRNIPLLISTWGNDFTLHAALSPSIKWLTRRAMARCDALHSDCRRDLRLAAQAGFSLQKPHAILPGNGGLDTGIFSPGRPAEDVRQRWSLPRKTQLVVNPRGIRPYVRNDTFFKAISLVLESVCDAHFLCVGMAGNAFANSWVSRLGIGHCVTLLPALSRLQMRDLFREAVVSVSPSQHDGTPNTLLEAMACGSFPVAGDIQSVREWLQDGENALLCDPSDHRELAAAMSQALRDRAFRERAAERNVALIREQADVVIVRERSIELYRHTIDAGRQGNANAQQG